jgi:putative sigma-54 modulation protein
MRFEIRRRGLKVTEELRNYIKERLRLALTRFGRHIDLVRVYLRDVNGPRGGPGKKCRIVVGLPRRGRIVVTGADANISAAVTSAASRAGFAVKRHVKRRVARRRPPRRSVRRVPPMAASAHTSGGALLAVCESKGAVQRQAMEGGG